jgi:hypothetical protein
MGKPRKIFSEEGTWRMRIQGKAGLALLHITSLTAPWPRASAAGGPSLSPDQISLLREIARQALWHMPNSGDEVRTLRKYFDIENLRQQNPFDDDPPGG